jgi:hypothetical protein
MSDSDFHHRGSYGEVHVNFVTSEDGTSVMEILKVLLAISLTPLLSSLILPWVVPPLFARCAVSDSAFFSYICSIVEYPIVAVLPLWLITIFAGGDDPKATRWSEVTGLVILISCIGIMVVNYGITEPKWEGLQSFWNEMKVKPLMSRAVDCSEKKKPGDENVKDSSLKKEEGKRCEEKVKYPFITNYRAIVTYITVLAILAVDFTIFPRRFAKTKKYGYSLMDIGTGSFIFCNGIVAPEAKDRKSNLRKSWISSLPLFILGFIRLISVKGRKT